MKTTTPKAVIEQDRNIPLMATIAIAVALVIVVVYAHLHRPFASPLTFSSIVYLPVVHRDYQVPDERLGIAEHTPSEAKLLGLAKADYVSGQWRQPMEGDTAVFLRPTERPHPSTWLTGSWSATTGWHDETGFRQWVREHPGITYIVGNELAVGGSTGDGDWVNTAQYAQWYSEAWALIKDEDPTATVAPYGPVQDRAGLLYDVWAAYQAQHGTLMPTDFFPVHFYCEPEDAPWWCWRKLTHWIAWLESHRGVYWDGPRDYRLTEWGLAAWAKPVPEDVALALMGGMIPELRANDIGITQFAWWPSGNDMWPDDCTWLVEDGQPTALGRKYLELALD